MTAVAVATVPAETLVRESTLSGQLILSIAAATPHGMDMELRGSGTARVVKFSVALYQDKAQCVYADALPLHQVMVGRLSDDLYCLFAGNIAIDITPAAGAAINAWLARLPGVVA